MLKSARWLWCGISFAATVLALLSPWTAVSPLFGPLSLWVSKFLPLLLGGMTTMSFMNVSSLVIILPLIGGVILALPFLGLQQVWKNQTLNQHFYAAALGVFLVALGAALESALTRTVSWDPWQMLELAFVVMFGLLLIRSGLAIMRISQPSFASGRLVGALMLFTGACFSSFVHLPLGLLGSVVLYFVLGITFLRSPKAADA